MLISWYLCKFAKAFQGVKHAIISEYDLAKEIDVLHYWMYSTFIYMLQNNVVYIKPHTADS